MAKTPAKGKTSKTKTRKPAVKANAKVKVPAKPKEDLRTDASVQHQSSTEGSDSKNKRPNVTSKQTKDDELERGSNEKLILEMAKLQKLEMEKLQKDYMDKQSKAEFEIQQLKATLLASENTKNASTKKKTDHTKL